ncbi:hypothetical protein SAMN05421647_103325 [Marinobacterium stanieri]|uniref:Uncharacterized protein n=1 Tax=Marinobacterium stanieri TaxID=49186 RepID=A0A1N6RH26_9GAMM|nr:hypothetical protein SAMN05421647_103325 [Marinobacterium stanieri]
MILKKGYPINYNGLEGRDSRYVQGKMRILKRRDG